MKDVIFFIGTCFFCAALDIRYIWIAIAADGVMLGIKYVGWIK